LLFILCPVAKVKVKETGFIFKILLLR